MNQDGKTKRVVVIGAGASGIGAARTLAAAGAEVIVLEGRDRIGGRMKKHCLTKNLSSSFGVGAEHYVNIQLGANWIHGMESTNPMFEVAQKLGLEFHQTSSDDDPGDDVILFDSGDCSSSDKVDGVAYGRVSKEDYHESLSRYEWIKEYVDHISVNYDKEDISLQAAFDLALKASESEIFGPCPEAQKRCLTWMYDRVSIDLGALSSKVSLNCYAEGVSDGAGGEGLVKYVGYSHVLHHLANEFPLDIRLNHAVSRIAVRNAHPDKVFEHAGIAALTPEECTALSTQLQACTLRDGRCVTIECASGETFLADACVVTVPVGALQADIIEFSPRPPSVITSVCSSLKLGLMNLVWIWYPEVFWPEECNFLGIARDDGSRTDDATCGVQKDSGEVKFTTFLIPPVFDNHGVRQPVLMCQIVGPYATTIESMSDADIAAEATSTLRAMFGAAHVPDPIGCAHSQWGSDPFARGSWSYFPYRADNSSFTSGSVPSDETVGRGAFHPDSAIVGAARESELFEGGTSGSDGSSDAELGYLPGSVNALHIAAPRAPSCETVQLPVTMPASPAPGCAGRPQDMMTAAPNSVTFASESLAAPVLHRAVSISEAASSVLSAMATTSVQPSAVRKYSDFGCTSDGTEDSSSESDSEDEDSGLGGAGSTSGSSASSSDESSALHAPPRHHHAAAPRTEDDVVSAHLYYASEAMSVQNRGTVHGAYLSGIREASKILAFLEERVK